MANITYEIPMLSARGIISYAEQLVFKPLTKFQLLSDPFIDAILVSFLVIMLFLCYYKIALY